jgi:hypothetical protein
MPEDVHDALLVMEQGHRAVLAIVQQPFDVSQSELGLVRLLAGTEAVVTVPEPPESDTQIARDNDTGMEPGELPGPARERDHPAMGQTIEHDVAEREVTGPDDEDDVTVHGGSASRLEIDDPRADRDRREVRGRDRAEGIGQARELRALLRHMEISMSRGGRRHRRRRYRWGASESETGKG